MKTNNLILVLVVLVSFVQFSAAVQAGGIVNIHHNSDGKQVLFWYLDKKVFHACDVTVDQYKAIYAAKPVTFFPFGATVGVAVTLPANESDNSATAFDGTKNSEDQDACAISKDNKIIKDAFARRNRMVL